MRRSTETFHGRVCGKIFISGKAAKLWDRYDPDLLPTQNLGHQKCGSVEKLQADLEVAAKRDERARGRELKRVAGERERQLWEEIESKKQIIDEPGVKVIDISFEVESAGGTKLSNTGFVLHLLRSNFPFPLASALAPPVFERNFQRRLPSSQKPEVPH